MTLEQAPKEDPAVVSRQEDPPKQLLLFFVESDLEDGGKAREVIRDAIERLANSRSWVIHPPLFVDEIDEESCSDPADEPIETVGGYLEIYAASSPERAPLAIELAQLAEVEALVGMLNELSTRAGFDFGLELDGELIGFVSEGRPDSSLETGLLGAWRSQLDLK